MNARIGIFGIGLAAYWPQFPGMKERLEGYQRALEDRVRGFSGEVVSAGLVDTPEGARAGGQLFLREDVDLILCYVATYATSSQVLPVVQKPQAPVLVLNLQPSAALDYETADTAEWLANCSVCCVPEIANAFARARIDFHVVSGQLHEDAAAWREIEDWCRAAAVDLGCQYLEVFRCQRRKGLDDQNAFGLQNLVLDHVWFTVMKAKTASTGISGLVPNSPRMVKKLIFASKEGEFPRTKAHAASRS